LSHTSSPLCSGYFGDESFTKIFAWAGLELDPPDLSLPGS
jgi:hypothetical protein